MARTHNPAAAKRPRERWWHPTCVRSVPSAPRGLVIRVHRGRLLPMPSSVKDLPAPAQRVARDADRTIGLSEVPRAHHLRLRDVVRRTVQQTGPHHLPAFAGNLAYNAFLASFPFLLLLLSV